MKDSATPFFEWDAQILLVPSREFSFVLGLKEKTADPHDTFHLVKSSEEIEVSKLHEHAALLNPPQYEILTGFVLSLRFAEDTLF